MHARICSTSQQERQQEQQRHIYIYINFYIYSGAGAGVVAVLGVRRRLPQNGSASTPPGNDPILSVVISATARADPPRRTAALDLRACLVVSRLPVLRRLLVVGRPPVLRRFLVVGRPPVLRRFLFVGRPPLGAASLLGYGLIKINTVMPSGLLATLARRKRST